VQTSVYSAEYSSTGGGVIDATTKSGSNRITGTVLWYNRNPDAAAAPFTLASTNRSPATLKYNQFSVAAGGPVYIPSYKIKGKPLYDGRNRTFWFGAIEPDYRRDYLDQYALAPTVANRTGDFSGMVNTASGFLPASVAQQFGQAVTGDATIYQNYSVNSANQFTLLPAPTGTATYVPFPNNTIPLTLLDPTAVKALEYLAPAGAGGYYLNSNGTVSNLDNPRLLRQDTKRYTLRIDQMLGANNRLYGRYTATPIIKTQNYPVSPTGSTAEYSYGKQLMLADTHTFSPMVMNDIRLNYTRGRFSNTAAPQYNAATSENLNALLGLPNITKGGVPNITGLGVGSGTGVGIGSGGSTEVEDREERYAASDILYKSNGRMSWKFGADFNKQLQNVIPLYAALGGAYAFSNIQTDSTETSSGTGGNSFASFLLGVPNGNVTLRSTEIPHYYRWLGGGAFVQNDWKIKPNLTLEFGHALEPGDASHGEIQQSGRVRSQQGANSEPADADDADRRRSDRVHAGAGIRVRRTGWKFAVSDAAGLEGFRASLRIRVEPESFGEPPHRDSRRLRTSARSGKRREPPAAAGFRRDRELCHAGAFEHGQSEQRDAAGLQSAGDHSAKRAARHFRKLRTSLQRPGLRQQPLLSERDRRLRDLAQLSHSLRAELEPDHLLAGEFIDHHGNHLRGQQGDPPVHAARGYECEGPEPVERTECGQHQHRGDHQRSAGPHQSGNRQNPDGPGRQPRQPVFRLLHAVFAV
jgi:hypothetical protein